MTIDLNAVQPDFDDRKPFDTKAAYFGIAAIEAYTADLPVRLIEKIGAADAVVGCMAWFTHRDILASLARLKHGCQIVVQKEDFIRPGIVEKGELQRLYGALRSPGDGYGLPSPANGLNVCGDACETVHPIRCMGVANGSHKLAHPRMHHKFFVFFRDIDERDEEQRPTLEPYAVWTGSFNATQNATRSRENALYIENRELAQFYTNEWARIYALSEPLNWSENFVDVDNAKRFGS